MCLRSCRKSWLESGGLLSRRCLQKLFNNKLPPTKGVCELDGVDLFYNRLIFHVMFAPVVNRHQLTYCLHVHAS